MSRTLIAYVATLVVLCVVDFVWLGFIAKNLYKRGIGHLMAVKPNLTAAVIFYPLFAVGLMLFAVNPALDADAWQRAAVQGALFGFFCYATYDLTNLATLKDWPTGLSVVDVVWGTFVSAVATTAGFFIAHAMAR